MRVLGGFVMRKFSFVKLLAVLIIAANLFSLYIRPEVRADGDGITRFVYSLYSECLGREPDAEGLNDWCTKLATGQITGKQAAYGFFYSPEFLNITMNSYVDETIDRFYRVFLDRPADFEGFYYWYDQVCQDGGSISTLFNGFADSEEFRNKCLSFGVNPGDHISVPGGYGRAELFMKGYFGDSIPADVVAFFETHADHNPRGVYPMCEKAGGQTCTITVSASDYAICQQFANEHFQPGWTDLQKIEYTAMWIRVNVHYAYGGAGGSYTDCIFNRRTGQCIQYNGALLAMMSYLGYDVRMVHGHIGRRHNNHYWGEMDINGVTYILDTGCIEDNNLHLLANAAEWGDYYTP